MKNKDLPFYTYAFTHLRRDSKNGGAPHKPILLLSILDAFDKGFITNSKIYLSTELMGFFKANWTVFVETNHDRSIALPFYHLNTSSFWKLIPNAGCELWVKSKDSMRRLGNLQTAVKYAQIDTELFEILQKMENRTVLRELLIEHYFPNSTSKGGAEGGLYIIQDIENDILNETAVGYMTKVKALKASLKVEAFEEEVILRSRIFTRDVLKNYHYACCISDLKVNVKFNNTLLVEACHIEPFSVSYIDIISNGIALSPTLHTAFDRGLLTLSKDYEVIISSKFDESNSSHGLKQFHGKVISLPLSQKHYPDWERIQWHQKHKFEK